MTLVALSPDLFTMERVEPSGFSTGSFVLRLPSGGTLLHGPVWLGDAVADEVAEIGDPEILFAPNHFHHLSLAKWKARFPKARVVASDRARPRLAKQKRVLAANLSIEALSTVEAELPSGVRFLASPGTKNGETFLSLPWGEGRALVVCDAFFHVTRPTKGFTGAVLRALSVAPGLTIGKTFHWLGVEDRAIYGAWLAKVLAEETPKTLFFSHGGVYDVGSGEELSRLVARTFGP
jgi:hypothetical protein